MKDHSARLTKWPLWLIEYDYQVIQRPGKQHVIADALNRAVGAVGAKGNLPDEKEFAEEQTCDPWRAEEARNCPGKVKRGSNGIFYWNTKGAELGACKIMVPAALRVQVLYMCHDTLGRDTQVSSGPHRV